MLRKGAEMYHIKDEKRMRASAMLICEGLAEALEEKPYASLSVTQVCAATGVARTTFYRLFDTLDDVLVYQFDQLFSDALDAYTARGKQEPFARVIIEVAASNKALVAAIVESGRFDLLSQATRAREEDILNSVGVRMDKRDRRMCTSILTQVAIVVVGEWAKSGYKETPDQLYETIRRELKILACLV